MNNQDLASGTPTTVAWKNIVANDAQFNTLEVKGSPINPPNSGQYTSNISLTNATNLGLVSPTQYYQVGNTYTIFGEFKCDIAAQSAIAFDIDLVPGTTNQVAKRTIQCSCFRIGGGSQIFCYNNDGNVSPSRLTISMNAGASATQVGAIFPYLITYTNN